MYVCMYVCRYVPTYLRTYIYIDMSPCVRVFVIVVEAGLHGFCIV